MLYQRENRNIMKNNITIPQLASLYQAGNSIDVISLTQIISKDANIAATITTQANNTNMNVMCIVSGFYADDAVQVE